MTSDGVFLSVYDMQGGLASVEPGDEGRLDAAVTAYLDSGGTRDSLIHLTMTNGQRYAIRASAVQSWILTTPEGRLKSLEIEQASRQEEKANRMALGIWEDAA